MLYNYLKISIRNILRHKLFSFINISGLVLSIAICLAAMMLIKNQLEFDKFHPHPERTYRVITQTTNEFGTVERWATSPLQVGEILQEEYDFVETTTRVYRSIYDRATSAGKTLQVWGAFTDPSFFDVFGFELESGSPETALQEPWSVILTRETAERFFEGRNPVGERFSIEGMGDFTVTGVLEPIEENTHLQFDLLGSFSTIPLLPEGTEEGEALAQWSDPYTHGLANTYLLTDPGVPRRTVEAALASLAQRVTDTYELDPRIVDFTFDLQTLEEVSPGEALRGDIAGGTSYDALTLLTIAAIALVILLMACFNYTNLSIARALKRAKEVGVYKVMGASRSQVFTQFTIEATLIALVALILAYAILPFVPLPPRIMEEVHSVTPDAALIGWFLLFTVFAGLLAGGLPALLISSVRPVRVLKNFKEVRLLKGLTIRKSLVVIQFTLSLVLIICTAVTFRQSQFMATSDYGFRTENIIDLWLQGADHQLLRDELSGIPGVEQISANSSIFGIFAGSVELKREQADAPFIARFYGVDENVITNRELTLLAGDNFPENLSGSEEGPIVINEQAVEMLELETPTEAIGQSVWLNDSLQITITGVVENFHQESKSLSIRPMVMQYRPDQFSYLNIGIAPSSDREAIEEQLAVVWERVAPGLLLQYHYADRYLYDTHSHEQDVASIGFYGLVALVIAALGLLGMVTYTVEVRTREVGIRKVLGAGVAQVIGLLSKEFVWLLAIATLIGLPIGYWTGVQFLNPYAYHITIGFGTLTAGLGILLLVGLLAIGTQTWNVAKENPVDALRSE